MPVDSKMAGELKEEIESTQTMSPGNMTFTTLGDGFSGSNGTGGLGRKNSHDASGGRSLAHRSSVSVPRAASVTGKLEVTL